jgi:glycosyltransferase involved in cell wall biosynthesis
MKITSGLLQKYNSDNSVLVISGYPKKGEKYSQGVCAVSSFTKNSLLALQKENLQRKIVILTVMLNDKEEIYEENDMLIIRCFKRNQPTSYLNLLKTINLFSKAKTVMVEFEFSSFGNLSMTIFFIPFVFGLRILGKNIVFVMHQVLFDLKKLHGHIGLSRKSPLLHIFNWGIKWFYKIISLPVKGIVVLEEEFKIRLGELIGSKKITVIPHGVDKNINPLNRKKTRKGLGFQERDFVILYFGFLTWYKGVDFLINTFKNVKHLNGKNIKILIAGGPSFTQGEKPHYQNFIKKIIKLSSLSSHIKITGFVKEKDISKMFVASDLVTLPYRTCMSSSGPLSLTLSHRKPFILSKNLKDLTKTSDFKNALNLINVSQSDFIFDFKSKSLINLVKKAMGNNLQEKLIKLSAFLSESRSFANLATSYEEILASDLKLSLTPTMLSIAK